MSSKLSDLVRGILGKHWLVYRLVNHTKNEIYFGCTKDYADRFKQRTAEETDAISHWDFERDDVEEGLVEKDLTKSEASEFAHSFEKHPPVGFAGYKVISRFELHLA